MQDVYGVLAVLAGGVDVAANVEPVPGDVVAGQAAGIFCWVFSGRTPRPAAGAADLMQVMLHPLRSRGRDLLLLIRPGNPQVSGIRQVAAAPAGTRGKWSSVRHGNTRPDAET